jgi:CTP synthase (UTP-ammonia lyase)
MVCVVLLLRYKRRQLEQRAAAQAGTEQHHDHRFNLNRELEALITKPSLSFVQGANNSEAPVAAIAAPSKPVELDSQQHYEIYTSPPTSSPLTRDVTQARPSHL